jgi:hypothetical protein
MPLDFQIESFPRDAKAIIPPTSVSEVLSFPDPEGKCGYATSIEAKIASFCLLSNS